MPLSSNYNELKNSYQIKSNDYEDYNLSGMQKLNNQYINNINNNNNLYHDN